MDKLKMQTVNKADENFKKLAAMFPNAVTETIDKTGEVVRAIDKDIRMQEISCKVVDGKEERYQFTWPDKKKSVLLANAPINKTLRPVRDDETIPTGADSEGKPYCSSGSVDFDNTENLYIEGDNLEALKLLQETYLGKIKMIYIMRKCCNDILGESNLVNCFIWNCSTAGGIRPKFASKTHEYILVYAKNKNELDMIYAPLSSDAIKMYTQKDEKGKYRDKDFVFKNKSTNVNQKYGIECPDGEVVYPKDGYIYRYIRSKFENALQEKAVTFKKTNTGPLITSEGKQAHWNIYIRKYLGSAMGAPSTLIPKEMMSIYNVGTQCVQDLFDGVRVFDNVKPVDVIVYLLNMLTFNGDTILDFFSGSATTAHAVMQLNAENGGNRKFIMVQLPEKTDEKSEAYKAGYKNICEIGKERIRRSAKKIAKENPETKFDGGFRVLKCDSSNMKDVYYTPDEYELSLFSNLEDNIKDDRSSEDLLFQVMLDLGVLLSSKIEETIIAGKRVLNVEDNYLIACFDENVTEEVIIEIAKQKPYYFIMRDSSMATDSVATNFEQIFAAYSPDTVRKVL